MAFLYVENDNDAAESASVTAPAPIEGQNQNEPPPITYILLHIPDYVLVDLVVQECLGFLFLSYV